MNRLRQFLNSRPWLGWVVSCVLLIVGVVFYLRLRPNAGAYSVERMSEDVTIKCVETGREWTMNRGLMEKELRGRGSELNPNEGLLNSETGRYTGFPFDKKDWDATISRLNREKKEIAESGGRRTRRSN